MRALFPIRGIPKTSSPHEGYIYSQVMFRRKRFPAFNLVKHANSLERAGNRVGKRLVLVRLLSCSGDNTCVSGVHIECISAGATSLPHFPQSP